jgi:AraC-like DNA-binding protein
MHNVWVSTSYGITCMQIVNDSIKHFMSFNEEDNIPNETFIDGKAVKLEDGTIVMQSLDHIVMFNPADFHNLLSQEPMQMFPKLTNLLVNGAYVTAGTEVNGTVILEKAITRTKEIDLNYDQNTISLTFSALNYARPLQTYYRVRIREISDEWQTYSYYNSGGLVDRRGQLHMPLVGLRPGIYHIELQASNVIDKFQGEPYEWIVSVNEPWWRATALMIVMGVILLLLGILNFIMYNRNTRLRVKRNSDEGDMVRRIQNYAERCEVYNEEVIKVSLEDNTNETEAELSPDFIDLMVVILPYIKEQQGKFTIRELVDLSGKDMSSFFQTLSKNLYKNPRSLARIMRLLQVQNLLRNTDKSIEDIAIECHFESPNGLLSSFYHYFRMTPREYRLSI